MIEYEAPLAEMRFALGEIAGLGRIALLPGCEAATPETVWAVLGEAAKLAETVLSPLNRVGDREPARLENGIVRTPPGFKDAYRTFIDSGWNSLPFSQDWGGQGLPAVVAVAVSEMWNAANLSFALCPLLTSGAIEALERHGSEALQRLCLPKLVSGEWTATMNLTEPQAGSDVGAIRTRAVPEGDHWRITGQKIFITYGDHDLAENIIHLVLARTPGAPSGTRGISLFLLPKFLVGPDGTPEERNDLRAVSLEHKLGIHGSPTAVMSFGDDGGAVGWLVGDERRGMECMFTMMNGARLNVGLQGVAISERAYQQARDYARTRIQGRPLGVSGEEPCPIVWHPDVRRMLLQIKATTEAARALAYYTASCIDHARHAPDRASQEAAQARVDLLIPLVKAWSTDLAVENTSLAIQIHGGMGYIEESGVAQLYRDARILPIYEGTNGIQAMDLVGRKLRGDALPRLIAEMRGTLADLAGDEVAAIRAALAAGLDAVEHATAAISAAWAAAPAEAAAGSVAYLGLLAAVTGGWLLAREAVAAERRLAAGEGDPRFNRAKRLTVRFYADQILPRACAPMAGAATILAFDPRDL